MHEQVPDNRDFDKDRIASTQNAGFRDTHFHFHHYHYVGGPGGAVTLGCFDVSRLKQNTVCR